MNKTIVVAPNYRMAEWFIKHSEWKVKPQIVTNPIYLRGYKDKTILVYDPTPEERLSPEMYNALKHLEPFNEVVFVHHE